MCDKKWSLKRIHFYFSTEIEWQMNIFAHRKLKYHKSQDIDDGNGDDDDDRLNVVRFFVTYKPIDNLFFFLKGKVISKSKSDDEYVYKQNVNLHAQMHIQHVWYLMVTKIEQGEHTYAYTRTHIDTHRMIDVYQ